MLGGPGDDVLTDPAPVYLDMVLIGGRGDDVMSSEATGIAMFVPGPGDDTMTGPAEGDQGDLTFASAKRGVLIDLRRGFAFGQGSDTFTRMRDVEGSKHSDILLGDRSDNFLEGGRGDDIVIGRKGRDWISGDAGNDSLDGRAGNDHIFGHAGIDTLFGRRGNDRLYEYPSREANIIAGGPGYDECRGGYRVPPNIERSCE
jgi:Ca2+-binding RTX toxin-like protein